MDNNSLKQLVNRIPLLVYRYMGSFPSDFVSNLSKDTFAIINTQPSNTPGEHWIMIAKFHHELYFADPLGLSINNYPFIKQKYSQMVRTRLQDHPSVCGFYTLYAAFHFFKFQQEEIAGVHDVNVLSVISITHVNNILQSIFSDGELYINNHQIYNSNGLYAHKSYTSNNFESTLPDCQGALHCEGYDYEEDPENLVLGPFFTRRMKLYSSPEVFMLYGKLGIDFLTTSELLYPNVKVRIQLYRARPNFYMISGKPNVSLGIVDCSLYTRRVMLKEDYHKKRISQLAYAPVEYN